MQEMGGGRYARGLLVIQCSSAWVHLASPEPRTIEHVQIPPSLRNYRELGFTRFHSSIRLDASEIEPLKSEGWGRQAGGARATGSRTTSRGVKIQMAASRTASHCSSRSARAHCMTVEAARSADWTAPQPATAQSGRGCSIELHTVQGLLEFSNCGDTRIQTRRASHQDQAEEHLVLLLPRALPQRQCWGIEQNPRQRFALCGRAEGFQDSPHLRRHVIHLPVIPSWMHGHQLETKLLVRMRLQDSCK